ncbi:MAG: hypothetical protein V2I65_15310 [Paracoccaceae bacterium]|nr:hypothetical protein [Paracoccaceae bacterium]
MRPLACAALLAVASAVAALHGLGATGPCPRLDTGGIECTAGRQHDMARLATAVMPLAVCTGRPALGVVFTAVDLGRGVRRRLRHSTG